MSSVPTAIKNVEIKVHVAKGALNLEKKLTINVLVLSDSHCHPLLSYDISTQ